VNPAQQGLRALKEKKAPLVRKACEAHKGIKGNSVRKVPREK